MKQISQRLLTALLVTLTAAMGLNSCIQYDNPSTSTNPLADKVIGIWWAEYDATGTATPDNPSPNQPDQLDYNRCIDVYEFKEDGTGTWRRFFLAENESEPQMVWGALGLGDFTYTSNADGTINITLNYKEVPLYPNSWTVRYADGAVQIEEGILADSYVTLQKATEEWTALFTSWTIKLTPAASIEVYNPNDGVFTYERWRNEDGIYIYDGVIHSLDDKEHAGFQLVPLPWYKGSRESNLPMNFCDNLTREAGWDLVMNNCGNNTMPNGNYFALYNKWTGTLRFFFYMPQSFTSGNDHLWEVTLSGQTALHQGLNYGLPLDGKIVNPTAIGMTTNGYSQYISPYAENRSTDGKLTPNGGWWAFDVDLSQYHPSLDISKDEIRLQMRSWTEESASFYSTITADIDGTFKGDIKEAPVGGNAMSATSKGLQAAFSTASALAHYTKGEYGQMFANFGNALGHVFGCAGEAQGSGGTHQTIDAKISLAMNGTINTEGVIRSSTPVTGIASPTFLLSQFDTKNTTMGQGIWNLKTAPVVWLTDAFSDFSGISSTEWRASGDETLWYQGNYHDTSMDSNIPMTCYPQYAQFYFFDPSSIEVELNPDLFPASEVEWTQVEAYCLGRADNGVRGTDNYRTAFGLSPRSYDYWTGFNNLGWEITDGYTWQLDYSNCQNVYDFLYYSDDKLGLEYPAIVAMPKYSGGRYFGNGYRDLLFGRGTSDKIAIEPMALWDTRNDVDEQGRVPGVDVMVTVYVKLKGMANPIQYTRHYLPEVKTLYVSINRPGSTAKMEEIYQNIKAHQPKGSGVNRTSPTYDYEMNRIREIFKIVNKDFKGE